MPAPADLVHQQSSSTGTGNLTLAAVTGRRTFAAAFGSGPTTNVFSYFITGQTDDLWEVGTGHMSNSTTLVRDTILSSSNANAAVNFLGGILDVMNDIPAADQYYTNKPLAITLPASTTKALTISQSGPTSGSGSPFDYNSILVNGDNYSTPGAGTLAGLSVGIGFGGSNTQGQRIALKGLAVLNTATSASNDAGNAYAGVSGEMQFSDDDAGTNLTTGAKGTGLGLYGSAIALSGATNLNRVAGLELNTSLRTGSTSRYHFGSQITQWNDHAVSGSSLDVGLYFGNQSGAIGWKDFGIVFDNTIAGVGTMFLSSATIIGTKGAMTVTNGIDFSSASFTGAPFKSYGFFISGSGAVRTIDSLGFSASQGAGTNVTQATSKSTAVTLNKCTGYINMNAAALAAGASVAFVVNNSAYSASTNDQVIAQHIAGGTTGGYDVRVRNASSTSAFTLVVTNNTGSSLSEACLIGFIVIKGAVN